MIAQENKVELVGHYGGDETHALSAWTSTSRDLSPEKRARIGKMLDTLASEGHHTPFEKSALHFLCTTEIASHIHILKHRVGVSVNGESARYKELKEDKFFIPEDWDDSLVEQYVMFMEHAFSEYHLAVANIEQSLKDKGIPERQARKRAKESARFFIPYGNQIECDVQFNFRSFYHFIKLRYSVHAQKEIREIARMMLEQVKATGQFDLTLIAFNFMDPETRELCEPFD